MPADEGKTFKGPMPLFRVDAKNAFGTERQYIANWPVHVKSLQSCPTLCDPMDCSPPGSSVHGILQARILECVALPFSRGSS